ncbi:hypothetical protein yc1106_08479 [Curvularia clavata]|uniref:DDE-1 domain-containing protein n=1 Tax=Curvularia clavata TaxID=95742 RepID=A0A9Q9DWQ3_CURCL|nr:hypothetical protein yc1106_08479 [Curvularia clavata]
MAPSNQAQNVSREADIQLAISAISQNQIQSYRDAALMYKVPQTTLKRRRAGIPARRDCQPNSKKLTKLEKEFKLVEQTKAKYGIYNEDVYNFDEASFIMGKITTQLIITASERRARPKAIQPGGREWVTFIAGINAAGWSIPPFLIFTGKHHLSAWYEEAEIPRDWAIAHFDAYTKTRVVGARRLLILDGHESHNSLAFQELYKENNIYTLCMPPHSSHLLQPLNVGCFSPLKRAYSREVESLIRNHINHITKLEFLPAFKAAFDRSFTPANICSAFRGAGLVPLQPEAVLSKLDVQLRTPTPPAVLAEAL